MHLRALNPECPLLHQGGRLAGTPVDPPLGEDIKCRDPLGDANRMVVTVRHQRDSVAQPDAPGARRHVSQKHLRRGHVGVFVQSVVFHRPDAVVTQFVGQHRLLDARLVERALTRRGGVGQLKLEKK